VETSISPNSPAKPFADLQATIRRRAEQIYIQSGRIPGRDLANWAQAEREIMAEAARQPRRAAVIVRVNGVQYVGEYSSESSDGYVPGEFSAGSTIPVRLHGERMFIQRPNGKILETTVVQKIE
jgi:hypothetical protein